MSVVELREARRVSVKGVELKVLSELARELQAQVADANEAEGAHRGVGAASRVKCVCRGEEQEQLQLQRTCNSQFK